MWEGGKDGGGGGDHCTGTAPLHAECSLQVSCYCLLSRCWWYAAYLCMPGASKQHCTTCSTF